MSGPSAHLIGGTSAAAGEYPYIVSIQYNSATAGWGHFCGGILYKSGYAITTAHCIDNKQLSNVRVVAGIVNLQGDPNEQIRSVLSYKLHPDYAVSTGLPNDIAILTVDSPFTLNAFTQNAVLPPDDSNLFIQNNCNLAGWGQTIPDDSTLPQVLQKLQTPVITNEVCASEVVGLDNAAIFDSHICTESPNLDTGSCDADNGSPLTCCQSDADCSVKYVAGITSYFITISGGCSTRYPSVHVRLSKFLSWIASETP
jgi:trypsin